MSSDACIFCDLIAGRRPGFIVDADEDTVSFLDIHPLAIGHVLVTPRRHVRTLADADDPVTTAVMLKVRDLTAALPSAFEAHGTFVLQNNEISQSVPHLHVHVVPRWRGDKLFSDALVWRRIRYLGEDHMQETAARIAAALGSR
jgi:histidine triad (HIT) family protein